LLKVSLETFLQCKDWIKNARIFANTSRNMKMASFPNGTILFLKQSMTQTRSRSSRWVDNSWSSTMRQVVYWRLTIVISS
jgi:hypothetical protein